MLCVLLFGVFDLVEKDYWCQGEGEVDYGV